jgi:hypothetical protein
MKICKKKWILLNVLLGVFVLMMSYIFFIKNCFNNSGCGVIFIREIIRPIFALSLGYILVSLSFLPANDYIFKKWLKHIFWWYFLITIITISNTPTVSSNIFHIDKGQIALSSMTLLLPITIIYILIQRKRYTTMKED